LVFDWYIAGLSLTSLTPFAVAPNRIASHCHSVIGLADMVLRVPSLQHVCIPFLNGFPTVDWSSVGHENRVVREEGGDGGCIVIIAALRVWMRKIILPGKIRRDDLARARRSEKDRITARDRRIREFPLSMSPNAVAKALREEGSYSKKTTVYHIEYRVRRLREKALRDQT
jgi:hypothetical protein